jgi:predicted amidohydrolase YtcJ
MFLGLTATPAALAQKQAPAEAIFINGNIYTGLDKNACMTPTGPVPCGPQESPRPPWSESMPMHADDRVQAIVVTGGRIVFTGSSQQALKLKTKNTQVIDLHGQFAMPGFNDAHTHLASAGFEKLNVDLVGARSLEEMQQRIAARAKSAAPGEWILGEGWDHTLWASQKLPTRQDIDAVSGDHPAIFTRVDGHIAVANTAALKAGGITAQTPDPHGGKIDHDAQGEPTGILRETARGAVNAVIPKPTPEQRRRGLELALADAAQWGITSAQDNSDWDDFLIYEQLEKEGKLTLRIAEWLPFDASLDELKQKRDHHAAADSLLHTTMLKGFMDGSLGSRTAAMLEPYNDDAGNSGIPRYEQEVLNRKAAERAQAGFQLGFHAIGDRGARMALGAFAFAEEHSPDLRFRIEHAQVVAPEDFATFQDMHVIASMQPNHLLTDMNWAQSRLGPERARHSYAWKEFLDHHVVLAFGTDYPVEPITPFRGLYAAVTRKNEAGNKEYFPDQKITIQQAIAAYTTGSAYAEFTEKQKGTLSAGMMADFVVLDRDITKVDPAEILRTKVLRTVVGGKTVYEANATKSEAVNRRE